MTGTYSHRHVGFLALLVCTSFASSSCGSAIVGGECKDDRSVCDGVCIDLQNDFMNCGQCGNDCGVFVCEAGMCVDRVRDDQITDGSVTFPDGSVVPVDDAGKVVDPDAGRDAEVPGDGDGDGDRDADMGIDADTGLPGCGLGLAACGELCIDLSSDVSHCGGCDNPCLTGEVCSAGRCAPGCDPGLMRCGATCFDLLTDARNCGGCGNVCASGICQNGQCADAVPGQLVVIGHDYAQSNRFQSSLLGNALFLARGAPVRTLVFEGSARQPSLEGAERAIDSVSVSIGRAWSKTVALEPLLTFQLAEADALLIHAQAGSSDSVLSKQGEQWGMALVEFVLRGGVIVVLDGGSPTHSGMQVMLSPSGLFDAALRERISVQDLEIVDPGVGIAIRVGGEYRAERNTVHFVDVLTSGVVVARDADGHPVVFQRIVRR